MTETCLVGGAVLNEISQPSAVKNDEKFRNELAEKKKNQKWIAL